MHKDDRLISSTNGIMLKYTIINATNHDHGFYYCEARNEAGSKNSNGDTLSVHYIRCQQKSDFNSIVAEGKSVSITCQVNAQPYPNYTFFKNNKVVKSGYVKEYMIENATEEDTGDYHCMAINDAGNVTCGQKNLLVQYIRCQQKSDVNSIVAEGNSVSITCQVNAQPYPNYTFFKNNKVVKSGYVKEYMIENATEEDTGNYRCMAINNAGNVTCGQKNLLVQCTYQLMYPFLKADFHKVKS
ncbi:hemicentin-1-like [Anneissia japonica]|uniref:hemicentin-1-like n=1 Tax=Anneissia japonica TaxID=1529436 RepID=UPI00142576F8|nr:hemicentin-1-like [Anneissia japonica]